MLRRLTNLAIILGFGVLICLPLALFSSTPWTDDVELRSSAPWPKLPRNLPAVARFAPAFEAWFNDHFGLRRLLIDGRNRLNFEVIGQSPTAKVVVGRNHWLFFAGNQSVEDLRGRAALDETALESWYRAIEAKRSWLAAQGIAYLFIVAPNKESIYPEYLPPSIVRGGPVRLDQLSAYLTAKGEPAWPGDLRPVLTGQKSTLPLYIPIDAHWNAYGSYLAYRWVIDRLDQARPHVAAPLDLAPTMFAAKEIQTGDLSTMMGLKTYPIPMPSAIYNGPLLICHAQEVPLEPLVAQASGVHWSPDRAADCPRAAAAGAGRALVLHDSMMLAMSDYLAGSFAHIRYAWMFPSLGDIKRYVATEHPDVVIEERVERTLNWVPPPEALPQIVPGPAPAADSAGWFEIIEGKTGNLTVEGWGEWQPQDSSTRLGFDTNLPVTASVVSLYERDDVARATNDPRLAGSGFRLQLALDPDKKRPDRIRLCVWTEDPELGRHRVSAVGNKDWDTCAGDHDGAG